MPLILDAKNNNTNAFLCNFLILVEVRKVLLVHLPFFHPRQKKEEKRKRYLVYLLTYDVDVDILGKIIIHHCPLPNLCQSIQKESV